MAAVLVLGGLVWLISGLFGGGQQYTVRAQTWVGTAQLQTATDQGVALRAQLQEGTHIELRRLPQPDGSENYELYVGMASSVEELKPTLELVQSAILPTLPAGERPFAGATIQPYTKPEAGAP